MLYLGCLLVLFLCVVPVIFHDWHGRRVEKKVDWLRVGEMEIDLFGHPTEDTRHKIRHLILTGDQAKRIQAMAVLDHEQVVHAGYERLADLEELATQIQMLDVKKKMSEFRTYKRGLE